MRMTESYRTKSRQRLPKKATSQDDLALLQHFRNESSLKQQQKTAHDDSAIQITQMKTSKAFVGIDEWNRSNAKIAAHMKNFNPPCKCQCQRWKNPQEPSIDPFASPGPRSLLHFLPTEHVDSPASSFKLPATVPFGWEEVPGKPKLLDSAASKPHRSLQLPPRLISKSFVGDRVGQSKPRGVSHLVRASSSSSSNSSSHSKKEKKLCYSAEMKRSKTSFLTPAETASPRSVLILPHLSSGSSSSSSNPSCSLDSQTLPATATVLEIWSDLTSIAGHRSFQNEKDCEYQSAYSGSEQAWLQAGSPLKDLAPPELLEIRCSSNPWGEATKSIAKLFRQLKGRSYSKRRHPPVEVPMWSPTLAAYFHCMEMSQISTNSEQLQLLKHPDAVDPKPLSDEAPAPFNCVCHCNSWERALQILQPQKSSSQLPDSSTQFHSVHLSSQISENYADRSENRFTACGSWLSSPQLRSIYAERWQWKLKERSELIKLHGSSGTFASTMKAIREFFVVSKERSYHNNH